MCPSLYYQPCITLVFSQPELLVPDPLQMAMAISAVEERPHAEDVLVDIRLGQKDKLAAEVQFEGHKIKLLGASLPLPEEITQQIISATRWQGDFKEMLAAHRSQIVLSYAGKAKDGLSKMIALYKVAHALRHSALVGVVNELAWTAHPVLDTLESERIRSYYDAIPFLLWFGYLQVPLNDELYWLVSKGHGVFNLPELAFLVGAGDEPAVLMNHLFNVFYYLLKVDGNLRAGDTLEMSRGGAFFRVNEMPDLPGLAEGQINPEVTLFLEQIPPDQKADSDF